MYIYLLTVVIDQGLLQVVSVYIMMLMRKQRLLRLICMQIGVYFYPVRYAYWISFSSPVTFCNYYCDTVHKRSDFDLKLVIFVIACNFQSVLIDMGIVIDYSILYHSN